MTVREFIATGLPGTFVKLARPILDENGNQLRFENYTNWNDVYNPRGLSEDDLNRIVVNWCITIRVESCDLYGVLLNTTKGA